MKHLLVLLAFVLATSAFAADAPREILLWPDGAPGSERKTAPEKINTGRTGDQSVSSIHKPSITVFLPPKEKATGAAVLVIPGGGHSKVCITHEGFNVANWLVDHGIAAFMLKYRLAREEGSTYTVEGHALPDTQRAMRLIRSRAAEWGLDPARLGAMGFSAGGELCALACMKPGEGKAGASDKIEQQSARPAFQVLVYPGHSENILPTKDSPPAFLLCGEKDREDISNGIAEAYLRFKRVEAPVELHIYTNAVHGFGVRPTNKGAVAGWPDRFVEWLQARGFVAPKS